MGSEGINVLTRHGGGRIKRWPPLCGTSPATTCSDDTGLSSEEPREGEEGVRSAQHGSLQVHFL